jgi:hypothetical protein
MTWLSFLFHLSLIIGLVAHLTVLYCVYPAFKRTKNPGFLFLFFGFLIGTFILISEHTIGLNYMPALQHGIYITSLRFASYGATVLEACGIVALTRAYLLLLTAKDEKDSNKM